jgi:uncharacterized membrane protein (GlpM family)
MTHTNCLNCEKKLTDSFCSGCGQKADTHRISFKNFIFHDVLHGTFHIEKGMFFTAKQSLMRPGKAALEYISGKRIRYYNVFYLTLITFGLLLFLRHFLNELFFIQDGEIIHDKQYLNEASRKMDELFSQKSKIIIFLFVPFAALNSYILFRRRQLNLAEHSIIAGMILLGMLLITLFGNLFFYFELLIPFNSTFNSIMSWFVTTFIIFHSAYGFVNAFGADYSKLGIACRIILFYGLLFLEITILFLIVLGFITHWKFGTVNITPFN